jgi:UTP--glucose-1-phosphate uridylyltransferase
MTGVGLRAAVELMRADSASEHAVAAFAHNYTRLSSGESAMIDESDIEPVSELPDLADLVADDAEVTAALGSVVMLKLNGGLATSMGLDRAKSLLPVKGDYSFLDIIVEQTVQLRKRHGVRLPLVFMNSFRTRDDTLAVLARTEGLAVPGLPLDFLQSREPKLVADTLLPIDWPADPSLQWCPPGHGDLYPALQASGLLPTLLAQGFRYLFCSNADNLGAVVEPRIAHWMAAHDIPFVVESTRRTAADRKGGHLARRRSDGRLVLRETAQTSAQDQAALQDLDKHRFCNTNNIWIDLQALAQKLDATGGVLDLPLIRNLKPVDVSQPSSPAVIQLETAMGSAVQLFDGARSILVERDRFVPVKTTNDLLVLRSDLYELSPDGQIVASADRTSTEDTFVDLDPAFYRLLPDFERRFPAGPPSLKDCATLTVRGDVTFGAEITLHGTVKVDSSETGAELSAGSILGAPSLT